MPGPSRRSFVVMAGAAGLTLGLSGASVAASPSDPEFVQTFIRIAPDNTVTVLAKHLDMGQGIWSGLASIVADEMDASWSQMRVEGAPAAAAYNNLIFYRQSTGGSTSIANSWMQLRQAGAVARGMLVEAAARRWKVAATDIVVSEGVLSHASGRQALFGELAREAASLPVPTDPPLKPLSLRKPASDTRGRLDTFDKVHGKTRFGIDVQLPDMKYAALRRPPKFRARLKTIDAAAARQVRGVLKIVTTPVGVAVIADSTWAAFKASRLLSVDWDESDCETRSTDDVMSAYRDLAAGPSGVVWSERGDCAGGLAKADKVVEATFEFPYLAHAAMEPLAVVCHLTASGCELWGGFQSQTINQMAVAKVFGLPVERVRLNTLFAGGSFGRRASFTSDWVVEVAEVVKAAGVSYPVKLTWTREDDMQGGYYRPLTLHRLKAGLDGGGAIIAVEETIVGQSLLIAGPYGDASLTGHDPTATGGSFVDECAVADVRARWISTHVGVPVHTFRGVSHNHTTFSKEVFMDALAHAAAIDPIAFRLANLRRKPRLAAVLRRAEEAAGWGAALPPGVARGVAAVEANGSFVAQVAEIAVKNDELQVLRVVCVVDCGLAVNPDNVRAQVEGGIGFALSTALYGKITLAGGQVEQSNFHDYPCLRMDKSPAMIEVHIMESEAPPTGIGEPGSLPTAAAVANALFSLTGNPVRQLPIPAIA